MPGGAPETQGLGAVWEGQELELVLHTTTPHTPAGGKSSTDIARPKAKVRSPSGHQAAGVPGFQGTVCDFSLSPALLRYDLQIKL